MKAESMSSAMMNLKMNENESPYQIKDFMLGPGEIPLLELTDSLHIGDVLKSIEDHKMGFTMLKSPNSKMAGIITNADKFHRICNQETDFFSNVRITEGQFVDYHVPATGTGYNHGAN